MRRDWPFLVFALVAVLHIVLVAVGTPADATMVKAFLMPSLLVAVLLVAGFTRRLRLTRTRGITAIAMLELALLVAWVADVVFDRYGDLAGMVVSGLFQLTLIAFFVGPMRARRVTWSAVPYAALLVAVAVTFSIAPGTGMAAPLVAGYAIVIFTMAYFATRVNATTGVGAAVFVVSALLKGTRLFVPGALDVIPAPAFDAIVMTLYCAGIGLVALGSVHAIARIAREDVPARRATAARAPSLGRLDRTPHVL
jgi:hypothetical protein